MTHTPGKWTVEHTPNDETYIMDGDDNHIATVWRSRPDYEHHAALIAAAPALYEALKLCVEALEFIPCRARNEAEEALRLAEGGKP